MAGPGASTITHQKSWQQAYLAVIALVTKVVTGKTCFLDYDI